MGRQYTRHGANGARFPPSACRGGERGRRVDRGIRAVAELREALAGFVIVGVGVRSDERPRPTEHATHDGRRRARHEDRLGRVPRDVGRRPWRVNELRDAVREQPDGKQTLLVERASDIRDALVRIVVLILRALQSFAVRESSPISASDPPRPAPRTAASSQVMTVGGCAARVESGAWAGKTRGSAAATPQTAATSRRTEAPLENVWEP